MVMTVTTTAEKRLLPLINKEIGKARRKLDNDTIGHVKKRFLSADTEKERGRRLRERYNQ